MAAPRSEYYDTSYENVASPPPGQGYHASHPDRRSPYDNGYDRSRHQAHHSQQQQPYFDPPPREEYPSQDSFPPSVDDLNSQPPPRNHHDYGFPPNGYTSPREGDRGYPPAQPDGALTPYEEEKAEAEWRRGVDEAYAYQRQPPPPSSSEATQRQVYDDDLMREQQMAARERERERERERRYWDERDERDRERERRKRRDEEAMKEKALRYPSDPKKGGRDIFGSSDGERGMAAKLAGGAGGAWIAHEKKAGALGTLGGIVVGALAGSILENQWEKRQEKRAHESRDQVPYPALGRDMDDVRRTGRDGGVLDSRGRPARSQSRPQERSKSGFRDRIKRSVSRLRSKSRPRRDEDYDRSRSRPPRGDDGYDRSRSRPPRGDDRSRSRPRRRDSYDSEDSYYR